MNLQKLIIEECANWFKNGCIAREGDSCLALQDKQCAYFERAIVPGASVYPAWVPGINEYHASTGRLLKSFDGRQCGCGELLAKRKRFCPACQNKRRKENTRKRVNLLRESRKVLM